jgi:hypothetical protein
MSLRRLVEVIGPRCLQEKWTHLSATKRQRTDRQFSKLCFDHLKRGGLLATDTDKRLSETLGAIWFAPSSSEAHEKGCSHRERSRSHGQLYSSPRTGEEEEKNAALKIDNVLIFERLARDAPNAPFGTAQARLSEENVALSLFLDVEHSRLVISAFALKPWPRRKTADLTFTLDMDPRLESDPYKSTLVLRFRQRVALPRSDTVVLFTQPLDKDRLGRLHSVAIVLHVHGTVETLQRANSWPGVPGTTSQDDGTPSSASQ